MLRRARPSDNPCMRPDLGILSVASPCSQKWDDMAGDDRVRFCSACEKNVYQLDQLSTDEVRALVVEKEGKLCWRFFVRKDGTVLTRDCPVGLRRARQRVVAALALCASVALAGAAGLFKQCGWFDGAVKTGCWSKQLAQAAVVPAPLKASGIPSAEHRMGGSIQKFDADNPY